MKNILANVSSTITKAAGKAKFKMVKYSPEILLAVGIVGFAGTVVLACKETLKADDILDSHHEKMEKAKEAKRIIEEEPENVDAELAESFDIGKEKFCIYRDTTISFVKLYWPSVTLGVVSLACILTSRNILHKRYVTALSAYTALSEAFTAYRTRVRDELGEDMDRHFRYGTEMVEKVTDVTSKGAKTEEVENIDSKKVIDETSVVFDESNKNWDPNPTFTRTFLKAQENIANNILHSRGHIFLNEVYDMLGFEHTPIGALVGWVDGMGDNYVDFGLYDLSNEKVRRFINGQENIILLEFNHDGNIWDKI